MKTYEAKYPKATECLAKDRDVLLTFYDFPAEHWVHIRTTNPIEIDVRDGAAAARQDEGEREPGGVPDDGLQADGVGIKEVAGVERFDAPARGRQGHRLRGRCEAKARRLRFSRPQQLTIPQNSVSSSQCLSV